MPWLVGETDKRKSGYFLYQSSTSGSVGLCARILLTPGAISVIKLLRVFTMDAMCLLKPKLRKRLQKQLVFTLVDLLD